MAESSAVDAKAAAEKSGKSGNVELHPLAIIAMSDHYTTIEAGGSVSPPGSKVLGLLWGRQQGLEVSIMDAVELGYTLGPDGRTPVISAELVDAQKDLYIKNYKDRELLGWYSVGVEPTPMDMEIHREMANHNESPYFLLMDPNPDAEAKDLPINLYEAEMHMINDSPTMLFVTCEFQLQTAQAERITMERVAKAKANDGVASLDLHMNELGTSLRTLSSRADALVAFLTATKNGTIPTDYRLLRQVASVCNQLPAIDKDELHGEFIGDYNDTLLVNYLATVTKGTADVSDLSEKFSLISTQRGHRMA